MKPDKRWRPDVVKFWREIHQRYDLTRDAEEILRVGCISLNVYLMAADAVHDVGIIFTADSGQVKRNPAVAVMKDSGANFLRAMTLLGIDVDTPDKKGPGRPTRRV